MMLSRDSLALLVEHLREENRIVIAPVLRNSSIWLDEINSIHDLPIGWSEDQDPGSYRLKRLDRPELFGHATPATPWRRWLYPERTMLLHGHRDNGGVTVAQPTVEAIPMAFFGIRSCDIQSLDILDRVFLDPVDPTYASRRGNLFVVAANCARPGGTCFCASMGTGPNPTAGYDIALTELVSDDRHLFFADAATAPGLQHLERLDGAKATDADLAAVGAVVENATRSMGRVLDPSHPSAAAGRYGHPRWDTVASRCLACANCTMVCPTCFCSTTEDSTDLSGQTTERWRTWDSCFTLDFSFLGGAPLRTSIKSRYRQWLLHKLVTWHDQFGISGCVGCGRCITWCPVGIDLTAEIAAVAHDPGGSQ